MVKYICEGCGWEVSDFGRDTVPAHQLCCSCEFLCEFITDPEEIERVRRQLGLRLSLSRASSGVDALHRDGTD